MKLPGVFSIRSRGAPWLGLALLMAPVQGWASIGAPSFPLAGAYFPAWLICLFIGAVGAALLRLVFMILHVDGLLRYHLVTYLSMGTMLGLIAWLLLYGQ